ncbi:MULTISPECIES: DUF1430 domain-containing protein [unclassified Enterococcus]|uniref:DUF1430 domain-containing protein n=1 Tax=unclassified Enterococcus TaxID=2608891 RepID=UPI0013EDC719|nr:MULTISPECIES: DUF1430 domain-containing protein [unclassified Enterococcus]
MIGFALVSINKQVLYRTSEFFHRTDAYTPIRLPQHFVRQEEYEQLIKLFENVSSETELSYMKKTVNESNEVDTSWNFKIQPKLEMTLYYQGSVDTSHEKVAYSNTSFRLLSIEESIRMRDFEGEFFLMTREKEDYKRFISLFAERFNQEFRSDYVTDVFEDFENNYPYSVISSTDLYSYQMYLSIGLILLFLLLPSFFLLMNKEISLLLNHGFSLHQVLWYLLGKKKIVTTLIIAGVIGGFVFIYYRRQLLDLFQMYVFLFSGMYGVSLISLISVKKLSLVREAFKYIQFIIFAFGLLSSLVLAVSNVELATIVFSSSKLFVSYEPPKEIVDEDYHVFYPVTIGKNHVDFIYSNRFSEMIDDRLYGYLNEKGSILVNITDYLFEENEVFGRGIKINPNYLRKFPLLDESANLIRITEEKARAVLLIPQKYQEKEGVTKIIKHYEELNDEQPEIIFIQDEQPVYTFIPHTPWIEEYPFIEVLTLENSTYWERNIFSGEIYPPLKIKTDGQMSHEKIMKLVADNQLSDNLQLLFSYTRAEEISFKSLSRSFTYLISIFMLTIISFFVLSYSVLCIYFSYNQRKIAILRTNGCSLFSTHKDFFVSTMMKWCVIALAFLFLLENDRKYLINIFLFSVIDLLSAAFFLVYLEKKNMISLMFGG